MIELLTEELRTLMILAGHPGPRLDYPRHGGPPLTSRPSPGEQVVNIGNA